MRALDPSLSNTVAGLTLVLPRFTTSHAGPEFTPGQLAFAAVVSLALYLLFVFTQTVRHRDFFLPPQEEAGLAEDPHDASTTRATTLRTQQAAAGRAAPGAAGDVRVRLDQPLTRPRPERRCRTT